MAHCPGTRELRRACAALFVLGALALGGCANRGPVASSASSKLTKLPVLSCKVERGIEGLPEPYYPSALLIRVPNDMARRLSFYSDGFLTVLGPKGWACIGREGANGSGNLTVYPPGQSDFGATETQTPNAKALIAEHEYTGHGPGAAFVNPLFPGRTSICAQQSDPIICPTASPGERVERPTRDIALFVDPAGVKGNGRLSGGSFEVRGVLIFPQDPTPPDESVGVTKLSCALPKAMADVCEVAIDDFVVRAFPRQ